jgi:hypothetical protein
MSKDRVIIDNFKKIIDLWPTRIEFAAEFGIKPGLASLWWQRDIIQPEYFIAVAEACARKGQPEITVERLTAMYTAKKQKRGAA